MYVSDGHRVGFVHIPKTGGTALKYDVLRKLSCRRVGHKHSPVQPLPEGYFIFAMVRNPYHRIASMYRFRALRSQSPRFREVIPNVGALIEQVHEGAIAGNLHPLCQTSYIDDRVRVYRFERFKESVSEICRRIGVPMPLMARRSSTHYLGPYDWRDFMDRRGLEIINETCREDFDRFGYPMLTWAQVAQR